MLGRAAGRERTEVSKSAEQIEPWIGGRPFVKEPDFVYYADRVAQTLARVTEVFGWDAAALLRGTRQNQRRLDGEPSGLPAPVPASGVSPATLDTPLGSVGEPPKRRRTTKALSEY